MTLGVVIGKFYPPHRGHHLLVDRALAGCDDCVVIVCAKPNDSIPGALRGAWLQELHPRARVIVIDDRYDENDTAVWAANTTRWLGRAPDLVFTSEEYGDRYAAAMGARHISVDRARVEVPISGTAVRADPYASWVFLSPPVRAWFAKRVCILGAESTGTTTLAMAVADALGTGWVPEYGRAYSVEKLARGVTTWTSEEFTAIAHEQNRQEDLLARDANRVLVCDTNAFATTLWHRRYMASEMVPVPARCDLYVLTGDEIPFVQDGLRDGEHIRHAMHGWFEDALARQSVPWMIVRGSPEERLGATLARVAATLAG